MLTPWHEATGNLEPVICPTPSSQETQKDPVRRKRGARSKKQKQTHKVEYEYTSFNKDGSKASVTKQTITDSVEQLEQQIYDEWLQKKCQHVVYKHI